MPGVVGIITQGSADKARSELAAMVEAVCHEAWYVCGTWVSESQGVYLGWVARSGSLAAQSPLVDGSDHLVVVVAGEPRVGGFRAASDGDTARRELIGLLGGCDETAECFRKLEGGFHGVAVFGSPARAVLFTDRYGIERLYYHEAEEGFYFGAEAKAILAARPETRSLDPRSLGELASCGCILEDRSLFRDIRTVPAASAWSFAHGKLVRRDTYFRPAEWEAQERLEPHAYYNQWREIFPSKLPLYFAGQERVAVALTGGWDTRAIMAWQTAAPDSLPCYTFGGALRESQDVVVARRVAQVCRQPHAVLRVNGEFLSAFHRYANQTVFRTEGCTGVEHAADLYVSAKARQIAPAKIVGTWGSEILCQAVTFRPGRPTAGLYDAGLQPYLREAEETYWELRRLHPMTFAAFEQTRLHHFGVMALEQSFLTVRAPFLDSDLVRTAYCAPSLNQADIRMRLVRDGNPLLAEIPSDRGRLRRATGAEMTPGAIGQELLFKAEYAFDMGMPHWLARMNAALAPLRLERLFLGRHKFLHFRSWYRRELAGYLQEVLLDPSASSRSYLERGGVNRIVREHLSGHKNHTGTLHTLLRLELVHRLFG